MKKDADLQNLDECKVQESLHVEVPLAAAGHQRETTDNDMKSRRDPMIDISKAKRNPMDALIEIQGNAQQTKDKR